jgi:hypothetical protein
VTLRHFAFYRYDVLLILTIVTSYTAVTSWSLFEGCVYCDIIIEFLNLVWFFIVFIFIYIIYIIYFICLFLNMCCWKFIPHRIKIFCLVFMGKGGGGVDQLFNREGKFTYMCTYTYVCLLCARARACVRACVHIPIPHKDSGFGGTWRYPFSTYFSSVPSGPSYQFPNTCF